MAAPYTVTESTIERWVEHECQTPVDQDYYGEAVIEGSWAGAEFVGWFKCPQCGASEDYYETHNPDNDDA